MKTVRYIYRTNFNLTENVRSIEEANDYLSSEDMTKYLKIRMPSNISNFIDCLKWRLTTEHSGYIELTTRLKLEEDELQKISEWVSNQTSDNFSEGFNWATNDYIFEFVEEKVIE